MSEPKRTGEKKEVGEDLICYNLSKMVLIKGAKIVDGNGTKAPYAADVLITGDTISAIGKFPGKKAEMTIDGLGLYLTPGFIDVNTDSDHHLSLFTNPEQQDFLLQGVTTIFGGHCGSSLAPLLYGSLDAIRKWTDTTQVNINWHTMAEFLKVLGSRKLGVNFGTLVGHSTIRRAIVGEDSRDLTVPELAMFKKLIADSMAEGAFGFSTGLGYTHSRRVPYSEIKELVKAVAEKKGVYATHLRDEEEGLTASVAETIKIAEETGANTLISHFKPIIGFEHDYRKAMELIHRVAHEVNIHVDSYPFAETVVPIYTLLPRWAQIGNLEIMLSYLDNPDLRGRLLKDLAGINGNNILIAQAAGREYLLGKTVHQFADSHELSAPEALLKLMKLTGLRATVFYKNINLDVLAQNLERDQVLIASNGASLPDLARVIKNERFSNTFPKFLEIVLRQKTLSLPQAIQKITSAPAGKFGLTNRGVVKEGNIADLNLISVKPGMVKVEHVFVNGRPAVQDRKMLGMLNGKVLKHA